MKVRFVVFNIFLGEGGGFGSNLQTSCSIDGFLIKTYQLINGCWIGLLSPETVKQKAHFFCGVDMDPLQTWLWGYAIYFDIFVDLEDMN